MKMAHGSVCLPASGGRKDDMAVILPELARTASLLKQRLGSKKQSSSRPSPLQAAGKQSTSNQVCLSFTAEQDVQQVHSQFSIPGLPLFRGLCPLWTSPRLSSSLWTDCGSQTLQQSGARSGFTRTCCRACRPPGAHRGLGQHGTA